ncbi:MAG: ABC transporter ATP-binding protein, partial [Desulfobacteraceae bacterium]|nr:ABC transporter ATP-binding protein [Desulfobacteraceae bacterium]
MLKISGIDVFRGETQVLWEVSLEVSRGERVAILGSNGAGKSSLLAAITGVLPARRGTVRFNGESLAGMKPHRITRMGVALVPEGRRVYREMTVLENLEMGAYPKRGRAQMSDTLERVLKLFPVLERRKDQAGGTLSGGEQQMLAIGRALMSRPELLFIDELSLGLAPLVTREIFRALDSLAGETTILLVEQNVEQALRHSQRAYVLESGRMTRSGLSADLMEDSDIRRA